MYIAGIVRISSSIHFFVYMITLIEYPIIHLKQYYSYTFVCVCDTNIYIYIYICGYIYIYVHE